MSSPDSNIEQLAATARQLHSLPAVAMEVLELTKNPTVDTRALKACIENDPALTTKLLRVVNSSLFGLSREVSDLNQALALLGTKPLKLLVLGFSLPTGLFEGIEADTLASYWRHTLTKAVAAREICETIFGRPGDEAFLAGLLEDLAVLLLIQELGEPYTKLLNKAYADGRDLASLEVQAMGFDHAALTARMLEQWGLPQTLVEAVGQSATVHDPEVTASPLRELRQVLHLAELIARLLADGQADLLPELLLTSQQYHAITPEQLDQLVDRLEEKVSQLAEVLSLQLPGGFDYRDILVQAHAQLSDVALTAAADLVADRMLAPEEESLADELQSLSEAIVQATAGGFPRPVATARSSVSEPAPVNGPDAHAPATTATPMTVAAGTSGLLVQLETVVAACRQTRRSLSLLLVELSDTDDLLVNRGLEGVHGMRRSLESLCRGIDHRCAICQPYGDFGFAVILADCDRQMAVRLGNQLIQDVDRLSIADLTNADSTNDRPTVGLGVGAATVALPPKNFPAGDLIDSADRCLYGSRVSGGRVVKSIEIY